MVSKLQWFPVSGGLLIPAVSQIQWPEKSLTDLGVGLTYLYAKGAICCFRRGTTGLPVVSNLQSFSPRDNGPSSCFQFTIASRFHLFTISLFFLIPEASKVQWFPKSSGFQNPVVSSGFQIPVVFFFQRLPNSDGSFIQQAQDFG